MEEIKLECGNCEFFKGHKDNHQETGICFRFPPTAYPKPTQTVAGGPVRIDSIIMRPQVRATEFCGEFLLRRDMSQPVEVTPAAQIKATPREN